MKRNTLLLLSIVIVVVVALVPTAEVRNLFGFSKATQEVKVIYPEIEQIKTTSDTKEQAELYRKLIERLGPEIAQEALFASGLPFDGQTHLLNHSVGNWLYERYGERGLVYCKDYFLSSCYHGFVIQAIAKKGLNGLAGVMKLCWEAGGYTTAIQCSHAIGHGILAYNGYKYLPKTLGDCDKVSQISENFPLYNCYDGTFMENIWAVHTNGEPSPDRWVKEGDNIYPCNAIQIAEKYKKACWSNQPMLVFQRLGNLGQVAVICLDLVNSDYQVTCFDAIARQIHPLTGGSVEKTFELCGTQPRVWQDRCVLSIARAAFSVGSREEPFVICDSLTQDSKISCFEELARLIVAYARKPQERLQWCKKIPEIYLPSTECAKKAS